MSCRYQLWLQYDNNKFWLSPRYSIAVEEETDFEAVNFGGGCCGDVIDRTWHFKLRFVGACDLASAWALYNQLQNFLDQACATQVDLLLNRQVCDETVLTYRVTKPQAHMIETITQFQQPRILTIDLVVTLNVWVEAGDGAVLVG